MCYNSGEVIYLKVILGVDIGGSTTKIVALTENKNIVDTLQVKAGDQKTSLYGAIGHILYKNNLKMEDVLKIVLTGVGAEAVSGDIYDIKTCRVKEFEAIGCGGKMLSGKDNILVMSMGTGTAFVRAQNGNIRHIGGSGVGGGTLLGLSAKMLDTTDIDFIVSLAEKGNLNNVDLSIGDISNAEIPSLPADATAANFGRLRAAATKEDLAKGLMNTVFQTAGMLAVFACLDTDIKDVVVTGTLASFPQAKEILPAVGALHNLNFIIPENAIFATAIGAALL